MSLDIVKNISEKFGEHIIGITEKSTKRIYLEIKREIIREMAGYFFKNLGARFSTASAVDNPSNIEILYHFDFDEEGKMLSLRTFIPKNDLRIDSIALTFKAGEWIEREIHELLGVNFVGHPNLKRLLLPDDWPENVYPLRKTGMETDA